MRRIHLSLPLFAALGLAACGGDDDHDHDHEDVASELCEHAQSGPFQTVTTSSTAEGAPSATFEHTSITLTLVAYEGDSGGCVTLDVDEAGEIGLAVSDADVTMTLRDAAGAEIAAEKTESIDACAEIARMDTFDVSAGAHSVCFGPTSRTEVRFGFEELSHSDHDHDHE